VVEECKRRLLAVGFKELREKESWSINPLGRLDFTTTHTSHNAVLC